MFLTEARAIRFSMSIHDDVARKHDYQAMGLRLGVQVGYCHGNLAFFVEVHVLDDSPGHWDPLVTKRFYGGDSVLPACKAAREYLDEVLTQYASWK